MIWNVEKAKSDLKKILDYESQTSFY